MHYDFLSFFSAFRYFLDLLLSLSTAANSFETKISISSIDLENTVSEDHLHSHLSTYNNKPKFQQYELLK